MKTCSKCKCEKEASDFHKNRSAPDGLQGWCKVCSQEKRKSRDPEQVRRVEREAAHKRYWKDPVKAREEANKGYHKNPTARKFYKIKRNYGLSREEWLALLEAQNGVCAICKQKPTKDAKLCVDHSHLTNSVRGLLCRSCNVGIGLLKESKLNFQSAIQYLEPPLPNSYVTSNQDRLDFYRCGFSPNFS